jgi:hypothetical protein
LESDGGNFDAFGYVCQMRFNRDQLKQRIEELANRNVFIGTSSWKYSGWCGMLYEPARYEWQGKFNHRSLVNTLT